MWVEVYIFDCKMSVDNLGLGLGLLDRIVRQLLVWFLKNVTPFQLKKFFIETRGIE